MYKVDIVDYITNYSCGQVCIDQVAVDNYYTLVLGTGMLSPNKVIEDDTEVYSMDDVVASGEINVSGDVGTMFITLRQHSFTVTDITEQHARKERIKERASNGSRAKQCCDEVRSYVAGFNMDNLTHEQITTFLTTFSSINTNLINLRVTTSQGQIGAITPDEVFTQELLEDIAAIYTKWGF